MMKKLILVLLFGSKITASFGQINIIGRVMMPDSNSVAYADVTFLGVKSQTTASGRFTFEITAAMQKRLGVEIGDDLPIFVEKEGLVLIQPANGRVRIPRNPMSQEIEIIMAKKGSPLLIKSDALLENIIRQRVNTAILEEKSGGESLRDVLAEEALRLGLDKEQLLTAMRDYRDSLRTSADLVKRGMAALDDANESPSAFSKQQKLEEAKQSFREAIQKNEQEVRTSFEARVRLPETYYNLGLSFFNEARYDSAIVYFAIADSLAPNDAEKLNMLGRALETLAQYDQALQVFHHALGIDTTTHGRNHHYRARELKNIARVFKTKGDYTQALELNNNALYIYETFFGRNHPEVARVLNGIGEILQEQAEYAGALMHYNEALKIFEFSYGKNHAEVAGVLNNIGEILRSLGDYAGALEKFKEALTIYELYFGRNRPEVAEGLNNLGLVIADKGDNSDALKKLNEALEITEHYFDRTHPNVAKILNNIGEILLKQGDYDGALVKFFEALTIDEAKFGRNHSNVARTLNNIGRILLRKGDYTGSLEKYSEALKIWESAFGRVHPQVATALNNIALVLQAQGDYAGALEKYIEALKIDESYFGRNHPDVAIDLNNIAGVLESQGDYAGALEKYNEALKINESYFGRNHPNVARELNNIAGVLRAKRDYAGALERYNQALKIDESYFGRHHPNVAIRLNNIGEVLRVKGDYAGALEKYDESLAIFMRYLGPDHPNTKTVRENRDQTSSSYVLLDASGLYAAVSVERTPEALARVVNKHNAAIQFCYQRELKHNSALKGEIRVRIVISARGSVDSVSVLSSTLKNPAVEECVVGRIKSWTDFGPSDPARGGVAIKQTYVFGY